MRSSSGRVRKKVDPADSGRFMLKFVVDLTRNIESIVKGGLREYHKTDHVMSGYGVCSRWAQCIGD